MSASGTETQRSPHRRVGLGLASIALVLAGGACASDDPSSATTGEGEAWTPEQNISLIVHASAGGSSDLMARTAADILNGEGIIEQAVMVENRPGGSGAVAYNYIAGETADPHILGTISGTYFGTPASGQADYSHENYTHHAIVAEDASVLVVPTDSPYETLDDLIQAAKDDPGHLRFGGTQAGGADSVIHGLLQQETETEFSYVSFTGGGDVNAALLGGNVDVATGGPAEMQSLVDAGRLRALAVSTTERLEGMDVPTFQEQGVDLSFTQSRGFIGPSDLTEAQNQFWAEALTAMTETQAWQDYLSENRLVPALHTGEDAEKYVDDEWQKYLTIFEELGFSPDSLS